MPSITVRADLVNASRCTSLHAKSIVVTEDKVLMLMTPRANRNAVKPLNLDIKMIKS